MKNIMKSNQRGITLIALVVTIIVLIILASIGISTGIETIQNSKLSRFNSEMKLMQIKVNEWYDSWKNGNNVVITQGRSIADSSTEWGNQAQNVVFKANASGIIYNEEVGEKYRYYSKEYIKSLEIEGVEQDFFVNIQERKIVSYLGLEYKGNIYYTIDQLPEVDIYNVKEENKTGKPTFETRISVIEENRKWKIEVYDIKYGNGNIDKWNMKYRKKGTNEWKETRNLNFEVEQEGFYEIVIENNGEVVNQIASEPQTVEVKITEWNGMNNVPKIAEGMIPIKWNGENWVVCKQTDEGWYDYSANSMKWANIMLSDGTYKAGSVKEGQVVQITELGSMFVWIPRYAYSIPQYKIPKTGTDGITQNITRVEFLKLNTNEDANGNTYNIDYNADSVAVGSATPMIVHPAFSFKGKQLTGIWVAKFEASMKETNNNTPENNNVNDKTIKVLPNAESWRYINIGNIFKTCLNMKDKEDYKLSSSSDTHLMKNIEWGAVAYLTASQYGKVPSKNGSGAFYTANGDYVTNISQSTTGNVYGVYDMNGGSNEYVAAYWDNKNSNISANGSEEIFGGNELNSQYFEYFDTYSVSENEINNGYSAWNIKNEQGNKDLAKMAYERVQLIKNKKGDALYEITNEFSYYGRLSTGSTAYENSNWLKATYDTSGNVISTGDNMLKFAWALYGNDYILIGVFEKNFFTRGAWQGVNDSGIFANYDFGGTSVYSCGFRPVLIQ